MKNKQLSLKIALVYDKVNTWGGAERVLLALHEIFPEAPLFTSVYRDPKGHRRELRHPEFISGSEKILKQVQNDETEWAKVFPEVIPSFLQKWPLAKSHIQLYAPLIPMAFESFCFDGFDVVISVSSGEAKGIVTKPGTLHLCYCLNPTRYLWNDPGYGKYDFGLLNSLVHLIKEPLLSWLRQWDYIAAQRPDSYATTSETVKARIKKYYRREARVIYPFVDTEFFSTKKINEQMTNNANNQKNNITIKPYFLIVSRLTGYKEVDLAVRACQELEVNLVVVGDGPELDRLKQMVETHGNASLHNETQSLAFLRSRVAFSGAVGDQKLLDFYQNCQALIMPQEEDFGLTALEAQACGKPVIAYGEGGVLETVINGKTGLFFGEPTMESLIRALKQYNIKAKRQIKSSDCRAQAEKFSKTKFRKNFQNWVLEEWRAYDKII
jgi:glycosyltransferase involved in cell wall biosynthesis